MNKEQFRFNQLFMIIGIVVLICLAFLTKCHVSHDVSNGHPAPQPMESRLVVNVKADKLLKAVKSDSTGAWFSLEDRRGRIVVRSSDHDRFLTEMGMVSHGDSIAVKVSAPGMQWNDGDSPSLSLPRNDNEVTVPVWLLVKWIDQGFIKTGINH